MYLFRGVALHMLWAGLHPPVMQTMRTELNVSVALKQPAASGTVVMKPPVVPSQLEVVYRSISQCSLDPPGVTLSAIAPGVASQKAFSATPVQVASAVPVHPAALYEERVGTVARATPVAARRRAKSCIMGCLKRTIHMRSL
ncbi:hypothetical protein B0H16DRAFT_1512733 [Mycena metata]|uniref:Uncharacterized protein n=1 Tax=Mycena metata TaxID=1033252 RepID=A0AAD7JV20_9AGAR|nr:hypothetical protein B0H16DRAFT_1512733 [Mycena metata]